MAANRAPQSLCVTLGDPAGIGPQVTEMALLQLAQETPTTLQGGVHLFGPQNLVAPMARRLVQGGLSDRLLHLHGQAAFDAARGVASSQSGGAALAALNGAMDFVDAAPRRVLVTAPLNKAALALAGSDAKGHTELLAARLADGPVAMAFFSPRLQVVLATVHLPLRDVCAALTPQRLFDATSLLHAALAPQTAPRRPRLGLAGVNPHAGEGGLLGEEERTVLEPARRRCLAAGIDLSPPQAADTLFGRAAAGAYDGVVAMYHDQGLIPVKLLAFGQSVNVTLGLRVVRTSPDHGTAYDKVAGGALQADGMLAALRWALRLGAEKEEKEKRDAQAV